MRITSQPLKKIPILHGRYLAPRGFVIKSHENIHTIWGTFGHDMRWQARVLPSSQFDASPANEFTICLHRYSFIKRLFYRHTQWINEPNYFKIFWKLGHSCRKLTSYGITVFEYHYKLVANYSFIPIVIVVLITSQVSNVHHCFGIASPYMYRSGTMESPHKTCGGHVFTRLLLPH